MRVRPVAAAILLVLAVVAVAGASPESRDPAFGSGGVAMTPVGPSGTIDVANAMARQPDGKLVVVGRSGGSAGGLGDGDFAVVRYNADGSLDTSSDSDPGSHFSTDGKATTDIGADEDFGSDEARAVAIDANGRIVVAGFARPPESKQEQLTVVRYNADGSPDTSFSTDGVATMGDTGFDQARAVAIHPPGDPSAGKIVVAGNYSDAFEVARLNADGTPDTGFGSGGAGIVTTPIRPGGFQDQANAVAIDASGRVVLAGSAFQDFDAGGHDFALVRYNADGSLDTNADSDPASHLDGDGIVTTAFSTNDDRAHALAIQPDGKLVAAGEARGGPVSFGLARYNADGSLDTSFDGDGKSITNASHSGGGESVAFALAIRNDGKLVAAGRGRSAADDDFAIARYNADGSPDTSFDADGKLTTAVVAGSQNDLARAVAVDSDGRAVAAGYANVSTNTIDYDFAVMRALVNGDTVPPSSPAVTGTDPASPASNTSPKVIGSAEVGARVRVFTNAACTGSPAAEGTAAEFASPGIPVQVPFNSTTTFHAAAVDPAGHVSGCSASSVTYAETTRGSGPQPGTDPVEDYSDPPGLRVPTGSKLAANVNSKWRFTVPRAEVRCAAEGGVCDTIASATTAAAVEAKLVGAKRRKVKLGDAAFTTEVAEKSKVVVLVPTKQRKVLRRLRSVRVVVKIVTTNLLEDSVRRRVILTLKAPRKSR